MNSFEYANPESLDEAVALLSKTWGDTEVLAGGTDLVTSLKQELTRPRVVVSLKNVSGLNAISNRNNALHIGALTTLKTLLDNKDVQTHFPALITAASNIGSAQMQNVGTVGGDLLQRPRCWYFRNGFGLFGTDDGKSLVPDGDNRYHAVFGNKGPAYYVNPSSFAPALIALGASVTLQGPKGEREVPVADFFTTPKSENDREYVMKSNEILTGIEIPLNGLRNATYEIRPRRGLDWPMVTASVAFKAGNTASDGRVVLGHVAPVPWHSKKASDALNGTTLNSEDALRKVGQAAADGASPLSNNGYKVAQIRVAVVRAIRAATA